MRCTKNLLLMAFGAIATFGFFAPTTALAKNKNFHFDALGDAVYLTEDVAPWKRLIKDVINKEDPAFVVHIGDFQTDPRGLFLPNPLPIALTKQQWKPKRDFWWKIKAPLIVTPGDNDWSDTIVTPTGPTPGNPPYPPNPDPIGTLNAFRDVWYEHGTNVKFPFKIVSQSDEFPEFSEFIENKRWCYNGIVFVTIHTIGNSDNGLDPSPSIYENARQAIIDESSGPNGRIAANEAWLNKAFDIAERCHARGLVIFTQAYPGFYDGAVSPGFEAELTTIRDRTIANIPNNLQVLFIYGDLHYFNVDKPLPLLGSSPVNDFTLIPGQTFVPNFTSVIVPGAALEGFSGPSSGPGRVKIYVNFERPGLFEVYTSLTTK